MGFKDGEVTTGRVWLWKFDFVLATKEEVAELRKKKTKELKARARL